MKGIIAVVLTGVVAAAVWLQFRQADDAQRSGGVTDGTEVSGRSLASEEQVQRRFPNDFSWVSQLPNPSPDSPSGSGGYRMPLGGSQRNWVRIQEYVLFQSAIGDEVVASARKANGAITKDQRLSPFAARTLEMTPDEEVAVNAALESFFAATGEWTRENLVLDDDASDEDIVYRVAASPAEAEARLLALQNGLIEALGRERGIRLLNMIPLLNYYGGTGLFDMQMVVEHFVHDPPLPEDDILYDPYNLQFRMSVLKAGEGDINRAYLRTGGSYHRFIEPHFGKEVFAHLIAGKEGETGAPEAAEGAEPSGGP